MSGEILIFWLIHLFIGIMLPALAYMGCCRRETEQEKREKTRFLSSHR